MKLTECFKAKRVVWVALVAAALSTNLQAQTQQGRAEVRSVRGSATYSTANTPAQPLKVGTVLPAGATIKTAIDSQVDLFLGSSAGVVRVTETTTLGLNTLTFTETGADTVVEVQLELPEGTILGNVNKLSAASKYEIKTPNGVAGIRGTRYRCSSTSFILLLDGSLVFVHVPPNSPNPIPYTLKAPPAVYFSPLEGVKTAPQDLVDSVIRQFQDAGAGDPLPAKPGQDLAKQVADQVDADKKVVAADGDTPVRVESDTGNPNPDPSPVTP